MCVFVYIESVIHLFTSLTYIKYLRIIKRDWGLIKTAISLI